VARSQAVSACTASYPAVVDTQRLTGPYPFNRRAYLVPAEFAKSHPPCVCKVWRAAIHVPGGLATSLRHATTLSSRGTGGAQLKERNETSLPLAQRLGSTQSVRRLRSASAGLDNVSRLSCSEAPRAGGSCGATGANVRAAISGPRRMRPACRRPTTACVRRLGRRARQTAR
jgi:hypothetical protein